jgi:aromatic ring-opening dioxygenase LigB subunit
MGIVFGGIAPHGFPLIPDLSDTAEGALRTRAALQELGRQCAESGADVVVIAGPHGVRVDGFVALSGTGRAAGTLAWNGRAVEMNVPIDISLTDEIVDRARASNIPVVVTGFAGNRREQSVLPLDWGMLVPLWFLGHDRNIPGSGDVLSRTPEENDGPSVVLVSPSRLLPWQSLIDFGHAVAEAAEADGRRIAFIASCDWAHTHQDSGPYGFHPLASEIDARIVDMVERDALDELLTIGEQDASAAAIDGIWQALMLQGVLERAPMDGELLSYEAPTYYGMLVASWSAS